VFDFEQTLFVFVKLFFVLHVRLHEFISLEKAHVAPNFVVDVVVFLLVWLLRIYHFLHKSDVLLADAPLLMDYFFFRDV
jgi:hypothetical protein